MFSGGNDLNQNSAGDIPINSMYAGEAERQAAIPPPMEDDEEEEKQENPDVMKKQPLEQKVTETR